MPNARTEWSMAHGEVERIMARPYNRETARNGDSTWFARVTELPGCMTEGETEAEVLSSLDEAMRGWIAVQLEDREAIPEPAAWASP